MAEKESPQQDDALKALNKKNKTLMILMVVVGLLGVAGVGGTAAYFLVFKEGHATATEKGKEGDAAHEEGDTKGEEEPEGDGHASADDDSAPSDNAPMGLTFAMDDFLVNLDGEDTNRYLKVNLVVEVKDEKTLEELTARLPQLQDMTITLLSSRSWAELRGADGKYRIREELKYRYNKVLTKGKVSRIYFTTFVIQ